MNIITGTSENCKKTKSSLEEVESAVSNETMSQLAAGVNVSSTSSSITNSFSPRVNPERNFEQTRSSISFHRVNLSENNLNSITDSTSITSSKIV